MARMLVTLKIMPESVEISFNFLRDEVKSIIERFDGELLDKDEIEPIAFGLKALKLMFIIDESKGSDEIADEVNALEGVSSCTVIDMRRTIG